ncbi:MAG: hypothetical protein ABW321_05600, partial [Polyangiales bacterium]
QMRLLALLDDATPEVRERAAHALAQSTAPNTLRALSDRLAKPRPPDDERLTLQAIAGALLRQSGGKALPPALRNALFTHISTRLASPHTSLATSALTALRSFADPQSAPLVAQLLRTGSSARRAAAVLALGDFELSDTRRLLRFVLLQGDSPRSALHAVLALAEAGTERDADALAAVTERGAWPLPAASAYALARIAQRGVNKKHAVERALCRLGRKQDVYVRANVAAGLAALGSPACDPAVAPEAWLDPALPSQLRVAAVRWLQAQPQLSSSDGSAAQLLAACTLDGDPAVAQACRTQATRNKTRGKLLVRALAPDGEHVLRQHIVALALPDGSVFVGPSDANGQVLLPLRASDAVTLSDPAELGPIPTRFDRPSSLAQ